MRTINKQQFLSLCDEVSRDVPALVAGVEDQGQRTDRVMQALFERVCKYLGLNPEQQAKGIEPSGGYRLMQTLEEHMQPEFAYTDIIDRHLLMGV